MKVREAIEALSKLDPELEMFCYGGDESDHQLSEFEIETSKWWFDEGLPTERYETATVVVCR